MLCKKSLQNALSLELNTPFDLQLRTKSVPLSSFSRRTSRVCW